MPQIMKCWPFLRVSIIEMGTLLVLLFVFILTINQLSYFLVSPTFVDDNSNGQLCCGLLSWSLFSPY